MGAGALHGGSSLPPLEVERQASGADSSPLTVHGVGRSVPSQCEREHRTVKETLEFTLPDA